MILRRLFSFTILVSISFFFLLEGGGFHSKAAVAFSGQNSSPHLVIAKKTTKRKRAAAPRSVSNIRHHNHKKYTRVVLDLPARAKIKESKTADHATIELNKLQLGKRALRKIQSRKFPRAISIKESASHTVTITLDLSSLKKYELLTLRRPNRVVIDLFYSKKPLVAASKKKAQPAKPIKKAEKVRPKVKAKKTTPPKKKKVSPRPPIVTKATKPATKSTPAKEKLTKSQPKPSSPQKKSPKSKTTTTTTKAPPPSKEESQEKVSPASSSAPTSIAKRIKDLVVVIDPGHGGKDPGAMGKNGTKEKHIVLKIGRYLKDLIRKRLGSTVLLTREKDVFLNLEKRVEFANKNKADLFISIHVNSHPQRSIKGLEVYHFGKASDPRALEVAARENGMILESGAPPWQFIIADKLNDQKIEQSQTFAWTTNKTLVKTLMTSYKVKNHGVKTAPFYVLRFTTMPSILAEVAFVSNPQEEKRLKSKAFQQQLAEGMYKSIHTYIKTNFPTLS